MGTLRQGSNVSWWIIRQGGVWEVATPSEWSRTGPKRGQEVIFKLVGITGKKID